MGIRPQTLLVAWTLVGGRNPGRIVRFPVAR